MDGRNDMNAANRLNHLQRITYYTVVPKMTPGIISSLLHQDEKSDVFLSPHIRLCGYTAMAHIDSESLAKMFADACIPFLQKRYGIETTLEIQSRWEISGTNKLLKRIKDDSECSRRLNIDPPCRLNIDPGPVAAF